MEILITDNNQNNVEKEWNEKLTLPNFKNSNKAEAVKTVCKQAPI